MIPIAGRVPTLLESALLGRRAIGIDLNPLAILIARVKTTPIPEAELNELVRTIENKLTDKGSYSDMPLFQDPAGPEFPMAMLDPRETSYWYCKWFQPQVLKELLAIDFVIREMDNQAHRDFARVAFSNVLRSSSNAHSGYPNVMFDKKAPVKGSAVPPFLKALNRNREMVAGLSKGNTSWTDISVIYGNASGLPIASASADAVISHPPYVGSIPYAEYGELSLRWAGNGSETSG